MDVFPIFFNMKVCCVFSLDANEYTQNAIINVKNENHPKSSQIQ